MKKPPPTAAMLLALLVCASPRAGGGEDPALLTVTRIFASPEFEPEAVAPRWAEDGAAYLTLEPAPDPKGGQDIVRHDPRTGQAEIIVPAAQLVPAAATVPLKIDDYAFSRDRSRVLIYTNAQRVWRQNTRGDYWVLDRASRELRQLGREAKPASLMFAKLSPTGRHVAYVRDNDLYAEDLLTGQSVRLTDSGSDDVSNGTFDWVYEEEFGLRDGFRWSPDGASLAYWQIDSRGVREFPLVNQTDSLYPRITSLKYPKVGQRNSACRVGVVPAQGGPTVWLDVPGDPREHYLARMDWAGGAAEIVLQQFNRLQNTCRVMLADARSGQVRTVLTERDDAWVDVHDELYWLADGQRFTWISERDGWRHAYLVSRSGDKVQLATPGAYDVIRLLPADPRGGRLYFLASPENATQRYLYSVLLDGTDVRRLTPTDQAGRHDYELAPDGRWAIHRWSSFGSPPVVELVSLPEHQPIRTLATNQKLREKLAGLRRGPHEFCRVAIGQDVQLDAWCLRPPDMAPGKKYPLLVYVYGEPAGQTVVDGWGGKTYLWHLLLAQRGYVVMSFDNRGTAAPRGRAWRKIVYRQLGILGPAEQAAALERVLAERADLDPHRVGIWGWSGGGSSSLHAIFRYPRRYQLAMAVAPVANQRYYDTIYQERYMGLPDTNVDGFLKGSPIHYAQQLEGALLLVHGTGDDNCHYQGTEALINELIRHNKPFSMMAYPNRSHSIREGPNTTRHLYELLTRFLTEHLPPGPRE